MADTAPAEPLGLAEVKLNLRVNGTAEDALIGALIADAREYVETETGLVLTPRSITETARSLDRWIDLAAWPVIRVTEIRYPTGAGMSVLPGTSWTYSTARRPVRLLPTAPGWAPGACGGMGLPVEIDIEAGYAAPADIPRRATRAMHMLIAHWYENRLSAEVGSRAAAIEVPFGVNELLRPLRVMRL